MRRRSRASGNSPNAQAPKAAARKSRIAQEAARPRSSSAAREEAKVARLNRERDELLQQQRATAEVLKVISRSTFDLQVVFETMVESAAKLCKADFADIWRPNGSSYRVVASYQTTAAQKQYLATLPITPGRGSCVGRTLLEGKTVHIPDIREDAEYALDLKKLGERRTTLGVPLLRDGTPIGVIALIRNTVRPFTSRQIELVTTFADQAVIALENTRLLSELRELLERQTATANVLKVISRSAFDLQSVLDTLIESAARLCEAELAGIAQQSGDTWRMVASYRLSPEHHEYLAHYPILPGRGSIVGRVVLEMRTVQILNVQEDPEYENKEAAKLGGVTTMLGVPLLREGNPIGVLVLQRRVRLPFTDKQIDLAETFADQAVIAIENVRLFNETKESLEQQTATSDILASISGSLTDPRPVFNAIVHNLRRLFGARFATVQLLQGGTIEMPAADGEIAAEKIMQHYPRPLDNTSVGGQAMLTKQVVQYAPVHDNPVVPAAAQQMARDYQYNSIIAAPMLRQDTVVGAIVCGYPEPQVFDENETALIKSFAAQAVIAIENARLLNELRQRTTDLTESLEQQTATSEVLRVISSSPGELQPVFDAMLENAVRICDATYGNIYSRDGDSFRLVASYKTPPAFTEYRRRNPMTGSGAHWADPMLKSKTQVHIADLSLERGFIERHPSFVAAVELGRARSALAVPMLKEGEIIGAFAVARQEVRPFIEKQIALVTNLAAQAVIAIENTRLLNELRQRTDELGRSVEELRALGEVSQAVNSTLELETVLSTIVANAAQLSGTEAGAIYVFDDRQREFRLRATYGMDRELIDALARADMSVDEPNISLILAERDVIYVADLRDEASNEINDITVRAGFRARLIAPLMRGEDVVGLLVVRRRAPGTFPQNTISLIKTFAAQSAMAIENARLFQNVDTSLKELRTAQDRLVQTQKLASLGQLTAGIAHEIKNPLNFVNNFSSVSVEMIEELQEAIDRMKGDAKTRAEITELTDTLRDNLKKIVQHGQRADSIVKNMLLHSREGSGENRPVDINAVVEEAVNLAYHGARAEKQGFNIKLERSLDPAAGQVDCFPQEIIRVLLNLISNGFYAATKREAQANGGYEPTLTAATRSLGDRVEIRIRDNGTGVPPEVREKMFNPFFTTKPAGEGTGLGLSISHDIIVKQHSGLIEIDSEPGEYTDVRIVLPRAAAFPR